MFARKLRIPIMSAILPVITSENVSSMSTYDDTSSNSMNKGRKMLKKILNHCHKISPTIGSFNVSAVYNERKDSLSKATYESFGGYCREKSETRAKNRFYGKTIIVTGGAGNFGQTCAERMASEGANVVIFDIADGSKVAKDIKKKYGVKAVFMKVNITDNDAVVEAVKTVVAKFDRIDYLFNNAGYQGDFTKLHLYSNKDYSRVIDINVKGTFNVLKAVSEAMIKQSPQGGSIVQTASMAAHSAPANMCAYAASKAAVHHMTRQAAKDLAPYNIRVNSVSPAFIGPGFMWTRQIELQANADSVFYDKDPKIVAQQMINATPMKRYGSIDEVIGPVTFLLSDDASYLTGIDIQITGGMN